MFCICNEKYVFNKYEYYIPRNFSMEYKRYSIETNKIINEIIYELIENVINPKLVIQDNYFEYEEKELNEEYVSTGYFKTFFNIGNYLNELNII